MKTIENCKKEIMLRYAHPSWEAVCVSLKYLPPKVIQSVIDDLAIMYANAKLDEASEKASYTTIDKGDEGYEVVIDKHSILSLKDKA